MSEDTFNVDDLELNARTTKLANDYEEMYSYCFDNHDNHDICNDRLSRMYSGSAKKVIDDYKSIHEYCTERFITHNKCTRRLSEMYINVSKKE